jgi:hypothetical protein
MDEIDPCSYLKLIEIVGFTSVEFILFFLEHQTTSCNVLQVPVTETFLNWKGDGVMHIFVDQIILYLIE